MARRALLAAAALAPVLAAYAVAAGEPTRSMVLGMLLPPEEPQAVSIRQGALAAVAQANEERGERVRLAVRGRKGAWGSDAAEAARLLEDDGAVALVAPPGGAPSHLTLQVAGRTGVPVVSLCPDTSVTRTALPWMVRIAPSTVDEARAIFAKLPVRSWLAFVPAGRAGREATHDLVEAARGTGAAVQGKELVAELMEPSALKGLLSTAGAGGILLWLDPAAAGRLARSARTAGFAGPLAGPSWLASAAFAAEAGAAADGVLLPSFASNGGAARAAFERKYRELFHAEPDEVAALAHDAVALLIRLTRERGADGARRAFPIGETISGATGLLSFDPRGNRVVSLDIRRFGDHRLMHHGAL